MPQERHMTPVNEVHIDEVFWRLRVWGLDSCHGFSSESAYKVHL